MRILSFVVPPLENNAYLVIDDASHEAVVIDPGDGAEVLASAAGKEKATVLTIVNTHGHYDHTAGNAALQAAVGGKIAIHETDAYRLARNASEPRWYMPTPPPPSKADSILKEGSEVRFGGVALRVLHTPGHTLGSIALHAPGVLFSGDTVMAGRYGRYDGPGGSFAKLLESVRALRRLPPATRVYPGHGASTTLGAEASWMENLRYASAH
jgi:glyoxylase-like metal-dependent hydrolase (beta-lactamase superfamily II)